ncbi:unnamed protein product [Sphagnum troendelagicum]
MTSHDAAVMMGSAAATQEDSHSKTTQGGVAGIVAVNPPPSHVIITFKKTHVQMLDDDVSGSDSTGDSPLPLVRRKKRPTRRYAAAGYSSGEDEQELFPTRSVRHKVTNFHESDSSSEADTGFKGQPPRTATSKPDLPMGVIRGCESCEDCQKVVASWHPSAGRKPCLDEAPTFFPDEEEFKDPLKYIASIRARAEPYGICRVVPPLSWRPPCMLREDSPDIQNMQFPTRVQQVHKLQVREPIAKECCSLPKKALSGGKKKRGQQLSSPGQKMTAEAKPSNLHQNRMSSTAPSDSQTSDDQEEYFGFEPGNLFSLGTFEKYADAFKDHYFCRKEIGCQCGNDTTADKPWEPSVDVIEGEYWRIVEQPTEQIEVLYGADVETGKFRSGFPKAKNGKLTTRVEEEEEDLYEKSGWNLNNIARLPGSMLAFEEEDISGVVVPWLYIGMCFSSFCWHVEDHHFYSLNYMHWGAPKVWYGVPNSEALKLESAMKKHLPELFNEQPDLLHKLVTQLSPTVLKAEGVPVYKLVQQAGDFVITFPRAYHSGFNCGFNVAEAVNVAPADWLSHGQSAVELYCEQHRKTSVSHDKLLLRAARFAVKLFWHFHHRKLQEKDRAAAASLSTQWQLWGRAAANGQVEKMAQAAGMLWLCTWQALFGQKGGMLSKALKVRVEMEHARRVSLKQMGEIATKKMDSRYDATDERECEVCKYDLHLSAIGCECHPERFSCLLHVANLCSCPWSKKTLLYRYDSDQLDLLVSAVEENAGAVRDWINQEIRQAVSLTPLGAKENPRSTQVAAVCSSTNPPDTQHTSGSWKVPSRLSMVFDEKYQSVQVADEKEGSVISMRAAMPHVAEGFHKLETHRGMLDALPTGKIATYSVTPPTLGRNDEGLSTANESQKQTVRQSSILSSRRIPSVDSRLHQQAEASLTSTWLQCQTQSSLPYVIILSDDEDEEEKLQARVGREPVHVGASQRACGLHDQVITISGVVPFSGVPGSHIQGRASQETGLDAREEGDASSTDAYWSHQERRVLGETSQPVVCINTKPDLPTRTSVARETTKSPPESSRPIITSLGPAGVFSLDLAISRPSSMTGRADWVVNNIGLAGDKIGTTHPVPMSGDTRTPGRRHIVRVVDANREVELLNVGSLVLRTGWQSKRAIYPAGFKSRTRFISVRDISQTCMYESEIVDNGPQSSPLFKVSLPNVDPFISTSIDECWSKVRKSVNDEICRQRGRYGQGRLLAPPPLFPPVNALEMFGLTSPAILQIIEALDPQRQCFEYWAAKTQVEPQTSEVQTHTPAAAAAGAEPAQNPVVDSYPVLQTLFHKASTEELSVLHQLFASDRKSCDWNSGVSALSDELKSRIP